MRRELFMGELPEIRLSQEERRTLAKAAIVLGRLRKLLEQDDPERDDELTVDTALASHVCLELSQQTTIPA